MKYFVFDMDEAIAELYSAFYFITSLQIHKVIQTEYPQWQIAVSDSIKRQLNTAYKQFVKAVLKEEASYKPLGILRPGVLHVMKLLYQLQKAGKVAHVVIYSNNDSLLCLEFIRDVIHEHLGTTNLICECAHRSHPLRDEFAILSRPHVLYEKSWSSLKRVLTEGKCKAPSTLSPEDVYFFDDLIHEDLKHMLGNQYHQVPPYQFKASYERLADLYDDALLKGNVSILQFAPLVDGVYGSARFPVLTSFQHILSLFKATTVRTATKEEVPPLHDKGITIMKAAIYSLGVRTIKKKTHKRRRTHKNNI